MSIAINQKPFKGKAGNEKRLRRPLNFPVISVDNMVLVTVDNKHTLPFIDPETEIDQNLLALADLAKLSGVPSFRFRGDDMNATTSYLIAVDELVYIIGQLKALGTKLWVDWFDEYNLYFESDYPEDFIGTDINIVFNKNYSKALIPLNGSDWAEISNIESELFWIKYASEKMSSEEYTSYTLVELESMTKTERNALRVAIETATGADLNVNSGNTTLEILNALKTFLEL